MICESCGKNPATVHITEAPYDKEKRKEIHLCEECAREKGQVHQPSLPSMLGTLLSEGTVTAEGTSTPELACPKCGMTYAEFRSSGRLGCPEDYKVFRKMLVPFFEKIHGSTRHTGKSPAHLGRSLAIEQRLAVLQREMEKSVQEEDFERAADLRDSIQELKEKKDGT